jgi:ketosteroid isomerase-like protein
MYEAFLKGDISAVKNYWADNITWSVPGQSILAGEFRGKDAILEHFAQEKRIGGHTRRTPKAYWGDKNYGAILFEITSTSKKEIPAETAVLVCKIDNAKVVETRFYSYDQRALDEIWSS